MVAIARHWLASHWALLGLAMAVVVMQGCAPLPARPRTVISVSAGIISHLTTFSQGGRVVSVRTASHQVTFPLAANLKNLRVGAPVWLRCVDDLCSISPRKLTHGVRT